MKKIKSAIFSKIKGIGLIVLGTAILAGIFAAFYIKFLNIGSFAQILPAEAVTFFAEGNLETAEKYLPLFNRAEIARKIFGIHELNFQTEIGTWLGARGGIVLARSGELVYFVEIKDQKRFDIFFRKNLLPQDIYTTVLDNYFIASKSEKTISYLAQKNELPPLSRDSGFLRVKNNLSLFRLGFFYVNPRLAADSALENDLFHDIDPAWMIIHPLFSIFTGMGGNIIADREGIFVQTYTAMENRAFLKIFKKYRALLTRFVPDKDLIAFFGGQDAIRELGQIAEILRNLDPKSPNLFTIFMQSQFVKFLGEDLDFKNDVEPLLQNEFAVSIHGELTNKKFLITLELGDLPNDQKRIEKLQKKFVSIGGIFAPEVRQITLPDGTRGKELVAGENNVKISHETDEKNSVITKIDIEGQKWGVYYTFKNNVAIFASDIDLLKSALAGPALAQNETFAKDIQRLLGSSDEVNILNIAKIYNELGETHPLAKLLKPISLVTSATNYFDDGISAIHFFRLSQ